MPGSEMWTGSWSGWDSTSGQGHRVQRSPGSQIRTRSSGFQVRVGSRGVTVLLGVPYSVVLVGTSG